MNKETLSSSGYCRSGEHHSCSGKNCECGCHHSFKPKEQAPARRVIENFIWHPDGLFTMSGHEGMDARELSFMVSAFQRRHIAPNRIAETLPVMPPIGMPGEQDPVAVIRLVSFRRVQPMQLRLEVPWSMEREVI